MQAKNAAKGPLEAAAAGAQAARPPRRVGFNAACRAVAPDTPQAARAGLKAQGGPCKPAGRARRDDGHLPLQVSSHDCGRSGQITAVSMLMHLTVDTRSSNVKESGLHFGCLLRLSWEGA